MRKKCMLNGPNFGRTIEDDEDLGEGHQIEARENEFKCH
jgi:hypothetical protein